MTMVIRRAITRFVKGLLYGRPSQRVSRSVLDAATKYPEKSKEIGEFVGKLYETHRDELAELARN